MARFRATIKGTRRPASRLGHAGTGITADVNGWDAGISIEAGVQRDTDRDTFDVYMTGGSNGKSSQRFIGRVSIGPGEKAPTFTPAAK